MASARLRPTKKRNSKQPPHKWGLPSKLPPMRAIRLKKEHTGLLIGVVLAGVLLGAWNAGVVGAARGLTRASLGARLSGYQAAGYQGALGFVGVPGAPADAPAPAD